MTTNGEMSFEIRTNRCNDLFQFFLYPNVVCFDRKIQKINIRLEHRTITTSKDTQKQKEKFALRVVDAPLKTVKQRKL